MVNIKNKYTFKKVEGPTDPTQKILREKKRRLINLHCNCIQHYQGRYKSLCDKKKKQKNALMNLSTVSALSKRIFNLRSFR